MDSIAERVRVMEERIDEVIELFKRSADYASQTQRRSTRPARAGRNQPPWVDNVLESIHKISAELKIVKEWISPNTHRTSDQGVDSPDSGVPSGGLGQDIAIPQEHVATPPEHTAIPPLSMHNQSEPDTEQGAQTSLVNRILQQSLPSQDAVTQPHQESAHNEEVSAILNLTSNMTEPFSDTSPTFHCTMKDISDSLNEKMFTSMSSSPEVIDKGYFKLVVDDMPSFDLIKATRNHPGVYYNTFSSSIDEQGFVKLTTEKKEKMGWPSFAPELSDQVSRENLRSLWESALSEPTKNMRYFIGEPPFTDIKLNCGEINRTQCAEVPGIGTTCALLGFGRTCSSLHEEAAKLYSINLLRSGKEKLWLFIKSGYEQKLLERMQQAFPRMKKCSQAINHLSCLVTLSQLDKWQIPYFLDYTKPGEAIVIMRGILHQVSNQGGNYALAINFLYTTSPKIPRGYKFCIKSCGDPGALKATHLDCLEDSESKDAEEPDQSQIRKQSLRHKLTTARKETVGNVVEYKGCQILEQEQGVVRANRRATLPVAKLKTNPTAAIPTKRRLEATPQGLVEDFQVEVGPFELVAPTIQILPDNQIKRGKFLPTISCLVGEICGEAAFWRLHSLIQSSRDRSQPLFQISPKNPAKGLIQTINRSEGESDLNVFSERFAKLRLVDAINGPNTPGKRTKTKDIQGLLFSSGLEENEKNIKMLHNIMTRGRKWKQLCHDFDGLLCLIPTASRDANFPQKYAGLMYLDLLDTKLYDNGLQQFHSQLKSNQFVAPLCRVGSLFQASIYDDLDVPEFKWESERTDELLKLPIDQLLSLMDVVPQISSNIYTSTNDWPKPDGWVWDWPQNPTWVHPSDTQCDLCPEATCTCITTCLPPNKPRITNEGVIGQGVRVNGMPYLKGQIIGELVGELVPLDTYHDGWVIEFIRPDLNDEPVAQIYTRWKGNWVRKIDHSCDPSAKFCVMKISGAWRQMVVTVKDIHHNDSITAHCGREFLRGQGKKCFCEVCSAA